MRAGRVESVMFSKGQDPWREKGGLFHRTTSKKKPASVLRPRPGISRPGQAQEITASENSILKGQKRTNGTGQVPFDGRI